MAGFTVLQVVRIAQGVTTNEAWKWKEARRGAPDIPLPPHPYNRGWRRNFAEVLRPRAALARALRAAVKRE